MKKISQQLDTSGIYGTTTSLIRMTDIFVKLAQDGKPQMQADSSTIIEKALYSRYGNPPMKLINSLSDNTYTAGGSASLKVETTTGVPIVEFTSDNNKLLASELNTQWKKDILAVLVALQKSNPNIPTNEWSFFARDFVILGQQ